VERMQDIISDASRPVPACADLPYIQSRHFAFPTPMGHGPWGEYEAAHAEALGRSHKRVIPTEDYRIFSARTHRAAELDTVHEPQPLLLQLMEFPVTPDAFYL